MSARIQAIRGMHDILPEHSQRWVWVETQLRRVLAAYGYEEIRLPIVEKTELFSRSIGEVTDIVEKEMYTFADRNGESLTLRPEGTAGCLRACIEHGLLYNQVRRLWYSGPMFRHERPQKGRYRQFYQLGVEAYGLPGPDIDAELILLSARLWRALGVTNLLRLEINTLGSTEERLSYRRELVRYLERHQDALDEDSRRRLASNPLRVLDSKNPALAAVIADAPVLFDHLGEESARHFRDLTTTLEHADVAYTINPHLVRGLDYYGRTVFEWVTDALGAQGTVCAGGRYDGLIEQLGERASHAIGFALGMERLVSLLDERDLPLPRPHAYLIMVGDEAASRGALLAERLRDALPGLRLIAHCGGGGFKAQFRRADKVGADLALILGEDEIRTGQVAVKPLRSTGEQCLVTEGEPLIRILEERIATLP